MTSNQSAVQVYTQLLNQKVVFTFMLEDSQKIAQKDKNMLELIKEFLKDNKINSNIYKYRNDCYNLVIGDKISVYRFKVYQP